MHQDLNLGPFAREAVEAVRPRTGELETSPSCVTLLVTLSLRKTLILTGQNCGESGSFQHFR